MQQGEVGLVAALAVAPKAFGVHVDAVANGFLPGDLHAAVPLCGIGAGQGGLSRHIHALQKYRDDSAKELGYKDNPKRVRREEEKAIEITREVYSAAKLGETIHKPDIPRHNFIPKQPSPELPPPLD